MRITIVVVTVLLCATTAATAEESGSRSDGLFCSERCDAAYGACMRRRTGKGPEDCPGNLVRCRNVCEPAAARAAAKLARRPLSCRDACQADFDACLRRDDGKHGQACAKSVMVCRDACPGEPSESPAASAPPAIPEPPSPSLAPPPASPAPRSASPAPPPASAAESVRAVAPPVPYDVRSATSVAATPDRTPSSAAAPAKAETTSGAAAPRRPSIWSRAWCAVTGSCGSSATKAPVSCDDACGQAYDACVAHEDPKRGGGCAASSVRCRKECAEREAHP